MADTSVAGRFASEGTGRREIDGTLVETFAAPEASSPIRRGGSATRGTSSRRHGAGVATAGFSIDSPSPRTTSASWHADDPRAPLLGAARRVRGPGATVRGAALTVVVDIIRCGSSAYGRPVAVELSAENWRQLYGPPGFAHAFCPPDLSVG
jgi:hypothetical protein